MALKAKFLRVQLPCGPVTVMEPVDTGEQLMMVSAAKVYDVVADDDDDDGPHCARGTGECDCFRGSKDLNFGDLLSEVCLGK